MKNYLIDVFHGPEDATAFHDGVQKAILQLEPAGIFAGDNIFTFGRNLSFLDDKRFMRAFESHAETAVEKSVIWRAYVLCWAARRAMRLDGDFVECGCSRGVTARIVAECVGLAGTDRQFYLYDLFDEVKRRFADMPSVRVIKGEVPRSFSEGAPEKIAFLHIDMNDAEAEIGALEVLYDRIVPGAVVVFDDYGWHAYRDQKLAKDAFFAARNNQILELPTGQGLLIV